MRGIELIVSRNFKYRMFSLLGYIDINKYTWHMPELLYLGDRVEKQHREINSGKQLAEYLDLIQKRFILQINLRAFPVDCAVTEPKTFEEYERSDCYLVFLCYDGGYVEIYCKDDDYLRKIYNEVKDDPDVEHLEYKTDENDSRYRLYVY